MCRNVSLFSTISISKISLNACSFNYIRWLQDLIDTTSESYTDTYDPSREVMGIDMYASATTLLPLLVLITWLYSTAVLAQAVYTHSSPAPAAQNG